LELELDCLLLEELLLVTEITRLAREPTADDEQQNSDECEQLGEDHNQAEDLKASYVRGFTLQLHFAGDEKVMERGSHVVELGLARHHAVAADRAAYGGVGEFRFPARERPGDRLNPAEVGGIRWGEAT
jgi:hypothetical protein